MTRIESDLHAPPESSAPPAETETPVLRLDGVTAGYGRVTVLRDVDLVVPPGAVLALLGPNGAGKSTLLRTAIGLVQPTRGSVLVDGVDVTRSPPHRRAKAGICMIPEGRGIFRGLSVRENLRMQVPPWSDERARKNAVDVAAAAFPVLRERLGQTAGTMSGGQQQMLALARAYLCAPRVVMLDEVSMGLAPKIVDEIFESLRTITASGIAVVVVEQYVQRAIEMSDLVVLLGRGQVTFAGPASSLDEARVLNDYLGSDIASRAGHSPADGEQV